MQLINCREGRRVSLGWLSSIFPCLFHLCRQSGPIGTLALWFLGGFSQWAPQTGDQREEKERSQGAISLVPSTGGGEGFIQSHSSAQLIPSGFQRSLSPLTFQASCCYKPQGAAPCHVVPYILLISLQSLLSSSNC